MKQVRVILKQDVYNLGEEGDVREVAAGYARNFLIPQGLALGYSKQNIAYFEQRREVIEKRKHEKREEAKSFRERIESKVLELELPAGVTGKLFGSVNSATIAEKLASEGIQVERKKIEVPDSSIKMVGEYDVRIRLYGDEVAGIKVVVYPVGGKRPIVSGTAEPESRHAAETAGGVAAGSAADAAADSAAEASSDASADAATGVAAEKRQSVDSAIDGAGDTTAEDDGDTATDAEDQDTADTETQKEEQTG